MNFDFKEMQETVSKNWITGILLIAIGFALSPLSASLFYQINLHEETDLIKANFGQELDVQVNSISENHGLYEILLTLTNEVTKESAQGNVWLTKDKNLFFPNAIDVTELDLAIKDGFNAPNSDMPYIWPYITPSNYNEKEVMRTLLSLQEEMIFTMVPSFRIYQTETEMLPENQRENCYITTENEGIHYGLAFCSNDGTREDVYEAGFQTMIYMDIGEEAWIAYARKFYNCNNEVDICRKEAFDSIERYYENNKERVQSQINVNLPLYMTIESDWLDPFTGERPQSLTVYINKKAYTGSDYEGALCTAFSNKVKPELCR